MKTCVFKPQRLTKALISFVKKAQPDLGSLVSGTLGDGAGSLGTASGCCCCAESAGARVGESCSA